MTTDTIADLLTRIRNAQQAKHKTVLVPVSKMTSNILALLKQEGYIQSFERVAGSEATGGFEREKVFLKYSQHGFPVISELKRVSRPGRRSYSRSGDIPTVRQGLGVALVSTSQGVMTDREARKRGIGGEVLATVY